MSTADARPDSETGVRPADPDCEHCGERAVRRTCCECGVSAILTDCGHQIQPRPIALGRADGTDITRMYCDDCADCAR